MGTHRAERETTTTGILAGRGLLTAVAALAVVGGPAAGMAMAGEAPAGDDASQTTAHEGHGKADHEGHGKAEHKGEKDKGEDKGGDLLGGLLGGLGGGLG